MLTFYGHTSMEIKYAHTIINRYTFFDQKTKQTIYLNKETGLVSCRKNSDGTIDIFINGKFICANKDNKILNEEMIKICDGMIIDLFGEKFKLCQIK